MTRRYGFYINYIAVGTHLRGFKVSLYKTIETTLKCRDLDRKTLEFFLSSKDFRWA